MNPRLYRAGTVNFFMVLKDNKPIFSKWVRGLWLLAMIGIIGLVGDRLWLFLDHTVPAWDQADYLNGAIIYRQALQTPSWFNSEWWRNLWLLSPKIPPLTYILTVPFFNLLGISSDHAMWVMCIFMALLLLGVYSLGVILFDVSVGLWAALLSQLMPGLYVYRLEFLLDFPLTAIVTFSYFLLTFWYFQPSNRLQGWLKAIAFGLSLGLALMVKQTSLFFLFFPLLWVGISLLWHRLWLRLGQIIVGLGSSFLLFWPWYRTNWLLMLTSGKRATIDSALIEGDPSLTSLDAWTYYFKVFPYFLSWPLLLVPIVGLILAAVYWRNRQNPDVKNLAAKSIPSRWLWLGIFLVGGYLLSSLNINKDARYILPLYPTLALVLAIGLRSWQGRWAKVVRWGTIGLVFVLMILNLFPLGGNFLSANLSPRMQHLPYMGESWQNEAVITEILGTSPYLRSTLGVLPSTAQLNQHTFSFYGGKFNQQVAGRQVGVRETEIEADADSLDWFITKTGDQGSIPDAQPDMVKRIEQGSDFQRTQQWSLPDQSILSLYHRLIPSVEVKPIAQLDSPVQLSDVQVPQTAPPNHPIPIIYQWQGNWQDLQSGIVILTWENADGRSRWLHDHGIGMGALQTPNNQMPTDNSFQVIERTAMLPDDKITPGEYTLSAIYLNRQTGATSKIATPKVKLIIDPLAVPVSAPPLDLVTQLRTAAKGLAEGIKGVEPIFQLTARINQYDSTQDYVKQTAIALDYRLKQENNLDWAYGLAIAQVLQQNINGAISALHKVIQLDPTNPYHYGYLAFVYLYDWRGYDAQQVLNIGQQLNPNIPELKTLQGVAALMQGNLVRALNTL